MDQYVITYVRTKQITDKRHFKELLFVSFWNRPKDILTAPMSSFVLWAKSFQIFPFQSWSSLTSQNLAMDSIPRIEPSTFQRKMMSKSVLYLNHSFIHDHITSNRIFIKKQTPCSMYKIILKHVSQITRYKLLDNDIYILKEIVFFCGPFNLRA